MANLYFDELQIGSRSAAGPYLLSKDEIIGFATKYDPIPRPYRRGSRGAFPLWRPDGIGLAYFRDLHPANGSTSTSTFKS